MRVSGLPAGASNETIALDLEVRCAGITSVVPLILRPQRRGGILAPYEVGRQFQVMRAVGATQVLAPAVMWHEATGAVLGVPFFVMHRLRCETPPLLWPEGPSGPHVRAAAAALATVHAVDWRKAGLDFLLPDGLGTAPSPIMSEIDQWQARADRMGIRTDRVAAALERFLLRSEPADAALSLVHGDTNAGNYLFRGTEIVAVVDWELAAIGDKRSDFGFYAALSDLFGGYSGEAGQSVLSQAYEAVTGERLHNLEYYAAFGLYRMLVVMAGWGGGGFWSGGFIVRRLDELLGPRWAA